MASRSDQEIDDDDFADIYKEYTGPPGFPSGGSSTSATHANTDSRKRQTLAEPEEEGDDGFVRDPNAVPTDFTSREAKVWEAKSKATERNWKKRKEEEMICKICGESGHFTQGCPSTLGSSRRSQDFFERVAARDPNVRALFTSKTIARIEKDIGCKLKLEEKFLIVSGKDRLVLSKGVDAVHKLIKGDERGSSSQRSRSRSPERSPNFHRFAHQNRRQEKPHNERTREHPHARNSSQAYNKDDVRSRTRSPIHRSGWDVERKDPSLQPQNQTGYANFPQSLELLEQEYTRELMEISRVRDREEDEENYKHREMMREMRESYGKRVESARASHGRSWGEFVQINGQRRGSVGNYKPQYGDYNGSSVDPSYGGSDASYNDYRHHRH